MKILMFGWEFPPYNSGGLGTACHGLTYGLIKNNVNVLLVLPREHYSDDLSFDNRNLRIIPLINSADEKEGKSILLKPYLSEEGYYQVIRRMSKELRNLYGESIFDEIERLKPFAKNIALENDFDAIHCHDWMTIAFGVEAKYATGKPLILHIHSTEFDRTGNNPNQRVYDIERWGLHEADKIICVSHYTKQKILEHYDVSPEKIEVIHNAVMYSDKKTPPNIEKNCKFVLFLGRITLQKGPDYFIEAARKVLEFMPNVKFIIAGNGDMEKRIIERSAELGISDKILFTGFLRGDRLEEVFALTDVYVMPSVSEPFGITPLEAIKREIPVIISKQSGVSEILKHCLKVDFWDINEMTNKIVNVLKSNALKETLKEHSQKEIFDLTWEKQAKKCAELYNKVCRLVVI